MADTAERPLPHDLAHALARILASAVVRAIRQEEYSAMGEALPRVDRELGEVVGGK